jgi:hypothetical protein
MMSIEKQNKELKERMGKAIKLLAEAADLLLLPSNQRNFADIRSKIANFILEDSDMRDKFSQS